MRKILVVDDNPLTHEAFRLLFQDKYPLAFASSAEEAKTILTQDILKRIADGKDSKIGMVFIDYHLKGETGLDLYDWIRSRIAVLKVFGMTSDGVERIQKMKDHGLLIVIDKNKLTELANPLVEKFKPYLTGTQDTGSGFPLPQL